MGSQIFGIFGIRKFWYKQGLKNRKILGCKMVPATVLIFNSRLALNSVLEIPMTFAQK